MFFENYENEQNESSKEIYRERRIRSVTRPPFFHGWIEKRNGESVYFFAFEIVARKRGKAIGQTSINDDRVGNSNGTMLCNVTRQPRPTPSVNCVSTECSYMLANASFLARWRSYRPAYHRCRRFSIVFDEGRVDLNIDRWKLWTARGSFTIAL